MPDLSFFAVTAPGLEPFAAQELHRLGLLDSPTPAGNLPMGRWPAGGVEFHGSLRDLYRANLHLRTASRVLVRLGEFNAAAFSELRKKAGRLAWEDFLAPGHPVALRVTCHKSRLYHSDAVAERAAGAIEDRLGRSVERAAPQGDEADEDWPAAQLIVVRLVRDKCAVSLDTSGALLHRRGYRLATAKAPLRETLAAAMLLASGWDAASPLLDPFCGSGTIPVEAALMARGLAPGRARRFAFMHWPGFDAGLWQSVLAEAEGSVRPAASPPPILASDRDAGAIEAARANAARAGVADCINFSCRAVSAVEPPSFGFASRSTPVGQDKPRPGWVITNPPYGVRVRKTRDLRNLYARFGQVLRDRCPGWGVTVLAADARLARQSGAAFDETRTIATVNGGLRVALMIGVI